MHCAKPNGVSPHDRKTLNTLRSVSKVLPVYNIPLHSAALVRPILWFTRLNPLYAFLHEQTRLPL